MKKQLIKPLPDGSELKKLAPMYLTMWGNLIDYPEQEEALRTLFKTWKSNTDYHKVLVKVVTLDKLYSTKLIDVNEMARRIYSTKDFDIRVEKGDITLVDEICDMGVYTPFSFTSKYCSHHNPDAFPIYDSFVAKVLTYYRKRGKKSFTTVKGSISSSNKNKSYADVFYKVIRDFRDSYNLSKYTFKELDKFLWLLGKVHYGGYVNTLYYKSAEIGNFSVEIDKSGFVMVRENKIPVSTTFEGIRRVAKLLNGFKIESAWNTHQAGREIVKYAIEHPDCLP